MPRKARINAPGALQHIICSGIERRRIFWPDENCNDFVERLGDIAQSPFAEKRKPVSGNGRAKVADWQTAAACQGKKILNWENIQDN